MSGTPETERLEACTVRLTALEELVMHVERTVESLDAVVLGVQKRLDALEGRLDLVGRRIERLNEPAAEPPKLEDERPPHY